MIIRKWKWTSARNSSKSIRYTSASETPGRRGVLQCSADGLVYRLRASHVKPGSLLTSLHAVAPCRRASRLIYDLSEPSNSIVSQTLVDMHRQIVSVKARLKLDA